MEVNNSCRYLLQRFSSVPRDEVGEHGLCGRERNGAATWFGKFSTTTKIVVGKLIAFGVERGEAVRSQCSWLQIEEGEQRKESINVGAWFDHALALCILYLPKIR